ncbi:MAG TPA: protein-disulfide reductase, partial [Niabella sp.]|nr:protein-disulfide reductase [Niabella sp.]
MNKFFAVCLLLFSFLIGSAQDSTHVRFSYNQKRINEKEVALTITAHTSGAGVKLFPLQKTQEDIVFSKVDFDSAASKFLKGNVEEKANI